MERDGKILLLGGVTQESNTSLHALEELAGVPYHLQTAITEGVVIDTRGRRRLVPNRLHLWGWERDFEKAQPVLEHYGATVAGRVEASQARLIDAGAMRDALLPLLRDDPLFLLSEEAYAALQRR